jgi:hypothetical protein
MKNEDEDEVEIGVKLPKVGSNTIGLVPMGLGPNKT